MPLLRNLQRAFAGGLLAEAGAGVHRHIVEDGLAAEERLRIYRNSCRSTLVAALRLTYPAVGRLVGRDFFDEAAGRFALAQPPASGDLNVYGEAFAEFLAAFPAAGALPYLTDVARFEWALGRAANADDAPYLDARALEAVDPALLPGLRFIAHPSTQVFLLRYPADRIADAVLAADEAAMRAIDLASGPIRLAVHRAPTGVEAERLDASAYEFVVALCAGTQWARLVETAPSRASELLAAQLVKGRLTGFRAGEPAGNRT